MNTIYRPVFISGPHGGGKSTLVHKLESSSDLFLGNNFDIDFTTDFPSVSFLSHFERSLMRLYHRFFITNYAQNFAKAHPGKIILTNRTIYDSEAYISVYRMLNWISEEQFQKLDVVMKNFTYRPRAIVLNPPLAVIKNRLAKRRAEATRINRDIIFENEDSDIFLENLHRYFESLKGKEDIMYLEDDNDEAIIRDIIAWVTIVK